MMLDFHSLFLYSFSMILQCAAARDREFIYVPTNEGMTSLYGQLEIVHSQALSHGFLSILVIARGSPHYVESTASLCDVFVLPDSITCAPTPVAEIVLHHDCIYVQTNEKDGKTAEYFQSHWNLPTSSAASKRLRFVDTTLFKWEDACALMYAGFISCASEEDRIPILFQPRLVALHAQARTLLLGGRVFVLKDGSGSGNGTLESSEDEPLLVVVHWRRGDEVSRCRRGEDASANCGSVGDFVEATKERLAKHEQTHNRNVVAYVATNEFRAEILQKLTHEGFQMFANLNVPLDDQLLGGHRKGKAAKGTEFIAAAMLRLKQLNDEVFKKYRASNHPLREAQFAVELQLMIHADIFLDAGVSTGITHFVHRAREQREPSFS
jgi:hypothetical protein